MRSRVSVAGAALTAVLFDPRAPAAEIALGGGAGPAGGGASRSDLEFTGGSKQTSGTVLLGVTIEPGRFKTAAAAIGVDLPLAIHGSQRADVIRAGRGTNVYTERATAVAAPGVRIRFSPGRRLTPWLSFGAGLAVIRRTGTSSGFNSRVSQAGSSLALALVPAAGIDYRYRGASRWFVRGEVRNFLYRTPATEFVTAQPYWNRWNYDPVAAGSVGYRFR